MQSDYLDKFHQRLWLTMKSTTDNNGEKRKIRRLFFVFFLSFIKDEFRQTVNVTISVIKPSTPEKYQRQRTIHCQKQVS